MLCYLIPSSILPVTCNIMHCNNVTSSAILKRNKIIMLTQDNSGEL